MKAAIATKAGPPEVLQLREIEKPSPQSNEVLVKVHAATVTSGDVILRKLPAPLFFIFRLMGGPQRKGIPGHEFAGEIEAIGQDVTRFRPGAEVFGTTTGLGAGANAQYVCVPEEWKSGVLTEKPANLSYEEAAALPVGGMAALQILNKADIQRGQDVMIYGASGSVGTFAVQLAKHYGARVTAVCSGANSDWVKALGADQVIDYRRENFAKSGQTYDVIFDAVGKLSKSGSQGALAENGIFLTVKSPTKEEMKDLLFLKELAEAGKLKAVIDRRYSLEEIAKAHRYVESGRKKGNVVITVAHNRR